MEFFCWQIATRKLCQTGQRRYAFKKRVWAEKKIVFGSKVGERDVKSKLESTYLKLVDGGGFEILHSGELVLISPPTTGSSVSFLCIQSGLPQATANIRPLQRSLAVEVELTASMVSSFLS